MKNYESLLQDLLFGAKDLISKANNISDQFDMSIRLAEQVTKAIKVLNKQITVQTQEVVVEPVVENKAIEAVKQVHLALSKEQYEDIVGYPISQAAYDEYVDIFNRQAAGEEINLWIPDPEGLQPIPEGAIVSLAVQESPMYKHLFVSDNPKEDINQIFEEQEEVVEEEPVEIEEDDIPMPTDITAEVAGAEVVEQEIEDMSIEEVVEKVLAEEDNGVEIDIDEEPMPKQIIAEIDGENMDITEQFMMIKEFNKDLSYEETVDRAVDWVEFGINKETYDILNFIEDINAEVIQCKTYLAYYIDAMSVDDIVYYINYFASNIDEDEEGNEVYVNDELQLEFLNADNISAFLEYVQQNQQ
jgi:hypothetical protein